MASPPSPLSEQPVTVTALFREQRITEIFASTYPPRRARSSLLARASRRCPLRRSHQGWQSATALPSSSRRQERGTETLRRLFGPIPAVGTRTGSIPLLVV